MLHTQQKETRTGHGSLSPIVVVRPDQLTVLIMAAAADIQRRGQAVTYRGLAQYTDMPEYILRRVVELRAAAEGKGA